MATKHSTALTDTAVRNLKPGVTVIERADHASPGLRIRVSPAGRKTWFYRYRNSVDGSLQKITLGRYPLMSLADARNAWAELSKASDPKAAVAAAHARQQEADHKALAALQQMKQEAFTVERLVNEYAAHISTPGQEGFIRSWKPVRNALKRNLVERFGDTPARDLTRTDGRDVLDRLRRQGKSVMANRVRAYANACFNWGVERELLESNPFALLSTTPERARQVTLNATELKTLFAGLPKSGLSTQEQDLLLFILATGTRIGEACDMTRSELFLEEREWRIPGSRTKNGKQHVVCLSDLAMGILSRQPQDSSMVWANANSASGAVRRDTLEAHLRESLPVLKLSFVAHDMRRSMATWLGEQEVDDRVIDRMLNHQPKTLSRVYNVSKYSSPARQWWQAWGQHLQGLMSSNVVVLPRKRS